MKKTFPFHAPGKADARVVEGIKHEVREYVQRERRKTLPAGFDQWDFACRVGADVATAEVKDLHSVATAIDAVVQTGADSVYVEVIAAAGHRAPRITPLAAASDATPAPAPVTSAPTAELPTHLL